MSFGAREKEGERHGEKIWLTCFDKCDDIGTVRVGWESTKITSVGKQEIDGKARWKTIQIYH